MTAGRPALPKQKFKLPMVTKGKPPPWPMLTDPSPNHRELWRRFWRKPQATAWRDSGYNESVARYVIMLEASMEGGVQASQYAEMRQLEDRLGLSPDAMKRFGWVIEEEEKKSDSSVWPISGPAKDLGDLATT